MQDRNSQNFKNVKETSKKSKSPGHEYFKVGVSLLSNPLTNPESKHLKGKDKNELLLKRFQNSITFFQMAIDRGHSDAQAYKEITINMKNSMANAFKLE